MMIGSDDGTTTTTTTTMMKMMITASMERNAKERTTQPTKE